MTGGTWSPGSRRWARVAAWLPIGLYLALAAFAVSVTGHDTTGFEPMWLRPALNLVFGFGVGVVFAVLAAAAYLSGGTPQPLALGGGMLAMGIGFAVAGFFGPALGPPAIVAMHNVSMLLAGIGLLAGAAMLGPSEVRPAGGRRRHVLAVYGGVVLLEGWLAVAITGQALPPFFVQGQGPTGLRQVVLGLAILEVAVAAFLFWQAYRLGRFRPFLWYGAGLFLFAVGLAVVFQQSRVGDVVNWVGRGGQHLGGLYVLAALVLSAREARRRGVSAGQVLAVSLVHAGLPYRALVESASDAVVALDGRQRILYWNDAARQHFGYDAAEVFGADLLQRIVPADRVEPARAALASLARPGGAGVPGGVVELVLVDRHGRTFPAEVSLYGDVTAPGHVVVCVIRDITARRLQEQALRESEASYRALVDRMPVGLMRSTPDGRIVTANTALVRMLGFPGEASLRAVRTTDLYVDPDDRQRFRAQMERDGVVRNFEAAWRRRDGSTFWVAVTVRAVQDARGETLWEGIQEDITERRRGEEAQRRLATLVAFADDAIVSTTLDRIITTWNPAAERLFGWPAAEVLGRHISLIVPPDHVGEMEDILARLHRGERVQHRETVRVRRDGTRLDVSLRLSPMRDGSGRLVGISAVIRDLTQAKADQAALARSALVLANVRDAVVATDLDGRVTGWNEGAARLFGWSAGEMLGRLLAERFPAAERPKVRARIRDIAAGAEWVGEIEVACKDGSLVWIDARVRWIVDESGRAVGLLALAHDIGDRKRAEAERDGLLVRLQLVFDRMPFACILVGPGCRLLDWNPAAERIFGYRREEVLGKPSIDLIVAPSAREEVTARLDRVMAGDMAAHGTVENRTKDGRAITCEWYNTPLRGPDGRVDRILSMALDVTERLRLEEQYRQAQKMEAIGRLAGGVAHDFNNVLTVILGYGEMLLPMLAVDDPRRLLVSDILRSGERAGALTRQLLAFSRKQVLEPRIVKVDDVVRNLERMLRRLIGEDVALTTRLVPSVGRVKVDPGQLEQVIMNLAVNARDAMPHGGRLTIETRDVDLDEAYARTHPGTRSGRYTELSMTDTGHGMTAEVRAHAFEPFFTTKGPGEGTGLGLATVFGIVKQSDGHVEIDSEVGAGTGVRIYLPLISATASAPGEEDVSGVAGQGSETILLVEDEENVRRIARLILEEQGYRVLEASNGLEALDLAEHGDLPIDLLLTDVVMPGMRGPELVERLRGRDPALKVLFTSGYPDDTMAPSADGPRVEFLPKPFSPRTLAHKVRSVLDARS